MFLPSLFAVPFFDFAETVAVVGQSQGENSADVGQVHVSEKLSGEFAGLKRVDILESYSTPFGLPHTLLEVKALVLEDPNLLKKGA